MTRPIINMLYTSAASLIGGNRFTTLLQRKLALRQCQDPIFPLGSMFVAFLPTSKGIDR
jgi:hypothetical protein